MVTKIISIVKLTFALFVHFTNFSLLPFVHIHLIQLDNISAGVTEWKGLLKDYWSSFSKHCQLASNTDIRKVVMFEKTELALMIRWIFCQSILFYYFIVHLLKYIRLLIVSQVEKVMEKTFGHFLFASIDSDSRVCPRYLLLSIFLLCDIVVKLCLLYLYLCYQIT